MTDSSEIGADNRIDAAIDEVLKQSETTEATEAKEVIQEETQETEQPKAAEEVSELDALKEENRKVKNALSWRDKKLTRAKQENESLKSQLAQFQSMRVDNAPREEDFENYGDYLKAEVRHEMQAAKVEEAKQLAEQLQTKIQANEADIKAETRAAFIEAEQKAFNMLPDYAKVMDEYFPEGMPSPLSESAKSALLESDNAPIGIYAIAKDGKLDELNSLSTVKAAQMIARYTDKQLQALEPKKSNAPAPINSARGSAAGGKSIEQMSYKELRKEFDLY